MALILGSNLGSSVISSCHRFPSFRSRATASTAWRRLASRLCAYTRAVTSGLLWPRILLTSVSETRAASMSVAAVWRRSHLVEQIGRAGRQNDVMYSAKRYRDCLHDSAPYRLALRTTSGGLVAEWIDFISYHLPSTDPQSTIPPRITFSITFHITNCLCCKCGPWCNRPTEDVGNHSFGGHHESTEPNQPGIHPHCRCGME